MKLYPLYFTVIMAVVLSCASGPVDVPDDMPPTKIIQRAQEATDVNKYKAAIQYYRILRERYGNVYEYLCTAEYEIAFIQYKQKKYFEARQGFESLLSLYKAEGGEILPQQFKVLAEKVLAVIIEKGY
ncbi:MAG: hypothetical protein LBH07_07385 [Treponema sp.]|jgi:outer membrane protein assembly factor BamD (BamD/ComL family)|nr:hypothetical protein [Treponema sp.]